MKNIIIAILIAVVSVFAANKYQYAEVKVSTPEDIKFLQANKINIDRTSFGRFGVPIDGKVTVYVTDDQYSLLEKSGYSVKWTPLEIPKDITAYRTNTNIGDSMLIWQNRYPSICKRLQIGTSVQGRPLWVLKISDNVNVEEAEPELKFVSTMHGDEVTGMEMELLLIENLLRGYKANSDSMVFIVNNTELYVMPLFNPDGNANGVRTNANGLDLNRDFPEGTYYEANIAEPDEPEIAAMIDFSNQHNFVLSTNYHGGALVANYLYDKDFGVANYSYAACPDDPHATWLAYNYSVRNTPMFNNSVGKGDFVNGITNGCEWYTIDGGMQDWNYRYYNDIDLTLEISATKWPAYSYIPGFWADNRSSMFWLLSAAHKGIYGIVTDAVTGDPVNAVIQIAGINKDYFTDPDLGDYYRILKAGTYSMTVSATGYVPQTINNISVTDTSGMLRTATLVNVQLNRVPSPEISLSQTDTIFVSCLPTSVGERTFSIENVGALNLDYDMSIAYKDAESQTNYDVHTNIFVTNLGWTPAGTRIWTWSSSYNGGTLNGTPFAYVASATTGTSTTTGQLTSAIFNLSSYTEVYIKFEQYKSLSLGTAKVEVSNDGTTWYTLYTNTAAVGSWNTNNPDIKNILVPSAYLTSTARFRFNVSFAKNQGYWAIDNVEINGTVITPYNWLSFDGVSTLSGFLAPSITALINADYDANGLVAGVYNADIRVSSTDPYQPVINLPVKLSVSNTVIPGTPSNVVTSISDSNIVISWGASASATSYDVYSSDDPYGTFTFEANVAVNQYTVAYTAARKFYYIVAKNATKIEK